MHTQELRASFLHPKVTEHRGRIVKTTGDGVLIEFPSVVDAVSSNKERLSTLADALRRAGLPE